MGKGRVIPVPTKLSREELAFVDRVVESERADGNRTVGRSTVIAKCVYAAMKRFMAVLLTLSMVTTYSLPAYSGMVTTEQLLQQQFENLDRSALIAMLDREEVREQLVERGVDPVFAKERIAALSDAEINEIKSQIDELPAGSGVVGILVAVLLVLVILDIVGVTNIFSFIHPPR